MTMKRPNKNSWIYNPLAAAQAGYAMRDYVEDLEEYCDWLEWRLEGLEIEHSDNNCHFGVIERHLVKIRKELNSCLMILGTDETP
jgi:hypothetical protein